MTFRRSCTGPLRLITLLFALGVSVAWSSPAAAQLPDVVTLLRSLPDAGRTHGVSALSATDRGVRGGVAPQRSDMVVVDTVSPKGRAEGVTTPEGAADGETAAPERAVATILPRAPVAWHQRGSPSGQLVTAFPGRVESAEEGRIRLDNGAVVEVTGGSVGRMAASKLAILLLHDETCRLWVDGRRTYRCDVLAVPDRRGDEGIETSLLEISANGKVMRLMDGSYYRPRRLDWIDSSVWLAHARVVIIGETMINLDRASAGLLRVRPGW